MVKKKKLATAAAATFGVALASVYVTTEIQADIMDLTYNGGAPMAANPFFNGSGTPFGIDIDQIPNVTYSTTGGGTVQPADFLQWNDTYGGSGRTAPLYVASNTMIGPLSMTVVSDQQVIDPATFVGAMTTTSFGAMVPAGIGGGTMGPFDGTGSAFVAIRPRIAPDNLYWFKLDFTAGGDIVYSGGQYGSMGEALTVNGGGGPCDDQIGDLNGDGMITLLDVQPFAAALLDTATYDCEADINQDGADDLLDVQDFVTLILGG